MCDGPTDRPTDRRTDGRMDKRTDEKTDKVGCRVACTRLKRWVIFAAETFLLLIKKCPKSVQKCIDSKMSFSASHSWLNYWKLITYIPSTQASHWRREYSLILQWQSRKENLRKKNKAGYEATQFTCGWALGRGGDKQARLCHWVEWITRWMHDQTDRLLELT